MYVTLASNASKEVYGNANTAATFTNSLSRSLDFSSESWEVGVKKVIYHNKFKTIVNETFKVTSFNKKSFKTILSEKTNGQYFTWKSDDDSIIISDDLPYKYRIVFSPKLYSRLLSNSPTTYDTHMNYENHKIFKLHVKSTILPLTSEDYIKEEYVEETSEIYSIKPGSYTSIESILSQLNAKCKAAKFTYNHERVSVKILKHSEMIHDNTQSDMFTLLNTDIEHVTLQNGLHYILGFEKPLLKDDETAKFAPQMQRGLFAIFIYSNICNYSLVGDSMVPLLHVISMPTSKEGEIVSIDVYDPMYIPISQNIINEIEIKLAADTGEALPFNEEYDDTIKSIITLHFRPRQQR